jgi:hypothetical protein
MGREAVTPEYTFGLKKRQRPVPSAAQRAAASAHVSAVENSIRKDLSVLKAFLRDLGFRPTLGEASVAVSGAAYAHRNI